MTAFFIFILSLFSYGNTSEETIQKKEQMTTYYFIRHAEKDESDPKNRDPGLTDAGRERAQKWAEIFREVEFDLIYSSDFIRTRETAKTIAETQDKSIEFYDPQKLHDHEFQKKTVGKTVLVVGHSNTNPKFINLILGENKYEELPENEYGSLFIVNIAPDGTKSYEVHYIN